MTDESSADEPSAHQPSAHQPSAMDEAFGQLPRPDHPDFWRLSAIVLAMDGDIEDALRQGDGPAEANKLFEQRVRAVIDLDSLSYMALQRSLRILGLDTAEALRANVGLVGQYSAMYIDAFIMGVRFADGRPSQSD